VPRHLFYPVPQVDSAIIKIENIGKDKFIKDINFSIPEFFRFVRAGFINRRKLLQKNILALVGKENKPKIEEIWQEMDFDRNVRAQELGVEQWIKLFDLWKSV